MYRNHTEKLPDHHFQELGLKLILLAHSVIKIACDI